MNPARIVLHLLLVLALLAGGAAPAPAQPAPGPATATVGADPDRSVPCHGDDAADGRGESPAPAGEAGPECCGSACPCPCLHPLSLALIPAVRESPGIRYAAPERESDDGHANVPRRPATRPPIA